jgi:hypothetical protein
MKFRAFWDVASCSQVDVDRRFRDAYCLHNQRLLDVAPCSQFHVDRRFRGAYRLHNQGDDGGSTHLKLRSTST